MKMNNIRIYSSGSKVASPKSREEALEYLRSHRGKETVVLWENDDGEYKCPRSLFLESYSEEDSHSESS